MIPKGLKSKDRSLKIRRLVYARTSREQLSSTVIYQTPTIETASRRQYLQSNLLFHLSRAQSLEVCLSHLGMQYINLTYTLHCAMDLKSYILIHQTLRAYDMPYLMNRP